MSDENFRSVSRRNVCVTIGAATLPVGGGCLAFPGESEGLASSSIGIVNTSSFEQAVSLLVRDEDADVQLLEKVVTVSPDDSRRFDFEAESDEATISINAETETDSAAIEHPIRAGGTTSFTVSIDIDETISIGVGMQ